MTNDKAYKKYKRNKKLKSGMFWGVTIGVILFIGLMVTLPLISFTSLEKARENLKTQVLEDINNTRLLPLIDKEKVNDNQNTIDDMSTSDFLTTLSYGDDHASLQDAINAKETAMNLQWYQNIGAIPFLSDLLVNTIPNIDFSSKKLPIEILTGILITAKEYIMNGIDNNNIFLSAPYIPEFLMKKIKDLIDKNIVNEELKKILKDFIDNLNDFLKNLSNNLPGLAKVTAKDGWNPKKTKKNVISFNKEKENSDWLQSLNYATPKGEFGNKKIPIFYNSKKITINVSKTIILEFTQQNVVDSKTTNGNYWWNHDLSNPELSFDFVDDTPDEKISASYQENDKQSIISQENFSLIFSLKIFTIIFQFKSLYRSINQMFMLKTYYYSNLAKIGHSSEEENPFEFSNLYYVLKTYLNHLVELKVENDAKILGEPLDTLNPHKDPLIASPLRSLYDYIYREFDWKSAFKQIGANELDKSGTAKEQLDKVMGFDKSDVTLIDDNLDMSFNTFYIIMNKTHLLLDDSFKDIRTNLLNEAINYVSISKIPYGNFDN